MWKRNKEKNEKKIVWKKDWGKVFEKKEKKRLTSFWEQHNRRHFFKHFYLFFHFILNYTKHVTIVPLFWKKMRKKCVKKWRKHFTLTGMLPFKYLAESLSQKIPYFIYILYIIWCETRHQMFIIKVYTWETLETLVLLPFYHHTRY